MTWAGCHNESQPAFQDESSVPVTVHVLTGTKLLDFQERWHEFVRPFGREAAHCRPAWLAALHRGLGHDAYLIVATREDELAGILPLLRVASPLFGRFLVSLPYVNWAGAVACDDRTAIALIDRAVGLADDLRVRYLELRHERIHAHPALVQRETHKVQMRLSLKRTSEEVWSGLRSVVRTQIRKAEKHNLTVEWGRRDRLPEFHAVFSQNMRDLGTPSYGRRLFESILDECGASAELCIVRSRSQPIAAALAITHGRMTEVPSASALREYRHMAANSLMYWHLIQRAVDRGDEVFDFGRSTPGSGTYIFKEKWGARPEPATWQYYLRVGDATQMRPDNPKYQRLIRTWQRLPLWLTRLVGPAIVRGIP